MYPVVVRVVSLMSLTSFGTQRDQTVVTGIVINAVYEKTIFIPQDKITGVKFDKSYLSM